MKNNSLEIAQKLASQVNHLRVVRFFRYSDLRCGHEGLIAYAKEKSYDIDSLRPGEFLVFVNIQENKMKILTVNGILVYVKNPTGRKFDLNIVKYIPKFFNSTSMNYQGALTEMVMQKTKKAA